MAWHVFDMNGLYPVVRRARKPTEAGSAVLGVNRLGQELSEARAEIERLTRENGLLTAQLAARGKGHKANVQGLTGQVAVNAPAVVEPAGALPATQEGA